MYMFKILDPRNIPAAIASNDAIFAEAPKGVLGIEVTVPALAARCTLGNIDPQHTGGDVGQAAIEAACTCPFPADEAVLATVRADLDSVGAMAVLALRREIGDAVATSYRIKQIADFDKSATGPWQPATLPASANAWPRWENGLERGLGALSAMVFDHKLPFSERVAIMKEWLMTGPDAIPVRYAEQSDADRADLIRALESNEIHREVRDGIAVVETGHKAATTVGYSLAPVMVALNPEFRFGGGEPHRKFTICAWSAQHADIKSALVELAEFEPGWGGSPTIGGSPQGVSSALTIDQVVGVVAKHLK